MLTELEKKAASGRNVSKKEARQIAAMAAEQLPELLAAANRL